jgi:hypothetical protein
MKKGQTATKPQTNLTCPCGGRADPKVTAELKDGTVQAYCGPECRQEDVVRQKRQ